MVVTVLTLRCGMRVAARSPSASSIAGANPLRPTRTSPATASPESLEVLHLRPHRREPLDRVLDPHRQVGEDRGDAVVVLAVLLGRAHRHRYERTHVALRGLFAPGQQRAEAARDGGQDDVVDGATERSRTRLTSESCDRAHAQRRWGPIGPLSDDAGGGATTPVMAHSPRAVAAAVLAARPGERTAERACAAARTD